MHELASVIRSFRSFHMVPSPNYDTRTEKIDTYFYDVACPAMAIRDSPVLRAVAPSGCYLT